MQEDTKSGGFERPMNFFMYESRKSEIILETGLRAGSPKMSPSPPACLKGINCSATLSEKCRLQRELVWKTSTSSPPAYLKNVDFSANFSGKCRLLRQLSTTSPACLESFDFSTSLSEKCRHSASWSRKYSLFRQLVWNVSTTQCHKVFGNGTTVSHLIDGLLRRAYYIVVCVVSWSLPM